MKIHAQSASPKKTAKTLDNEIAALQTKLARLQAQKREKERKELERNQKAIIALLRTEKLDTAPIAIWAAALPALRKLLKVEVSTCGPSSAATFPSRPEHTTGFVQSDQDTDASKKVQHERLEASGRTT